MRDEALAASIPKTVSSGYESIVSQACKRRKYYENLEGNIIPADKQYKVAGEVKNASDFRKETVIVKKDSNGEDIKVTEYFVTI